MKSTMIKIISSTLVILLTFISLPSQGYANDTLYIITNVKNPIKSLSKSEIRNIFLGKIQSFPNGKPAKPINLSKGIAARTFFLKEVLKKNENSWRSHWARLLFTGKGKPPKEYSNSQHVLDTVSQKEQSIGYVTGDIAHIKGITVLMSIPLR